MGEIAVGRGVERDQHTRRGAGSADARSASPPVTMRSAVARPSASPQGSPLRMPTVTPTLTALDAATTPREQASAAARAVAAVAASGATSPIWRSRSMHCFTFRTKSPPVSSPSSRTVERSSPRTQPAIRGVSPGSGVRVSGRRPSRSESTRSRQIRSIARARFGDRRARPVRRRLHRLGVGTAALVGEARDDRRHLGGVEVVEEAFAERLGDDEVGLGVEPREEQPRGRELPALDVPPRLEHREHAIELAGEALGTARDAALLAGDVAHEPIGRGCGAQHPHPVGRLRERVRRQRAFELLDPLRGRVGELVVVVGQAQPAQRVGRGPLEPLVVGAERARQLDGREPAGPVAEVLGAEAHEVATFGEREHAVAAPAAVLLQHHDAAARDAAPRRRRRDAAPRAAPVAPRPRPASRLRGRP